MPGICHGVSIRSFVTKADIIVFVIEETEFRARAIRNAISAPLFKNTEIDQWAVFLQPFIRRAKPSMAIGRGDPQLFREGITQPYIGGAEEGVVKIIPSCE